MDARTHRRRTKSWKVNICIETTPKVNVTNFDKTCPDGSIIVPLCPNYAKNSKLIHLKVQKSILKSKMFASFGPQEVKNQLRMGFMY